MHLRCGFGLQELSRFADGLLASMLCRCSAAHRAHLNPQLLINLVLGEVVAERVALTLAVEKALHASQRKNVQTLQEP